MKGMMKMSITMPYDVQRILHKLNDNGYQGYVVGGAVRDYIMGIKPHDWDIATDAKPETVKRIFDKTIDTGLKHGTVTAMMQDGNYEITTYRADGLYSDGRHPDEVIFKDTIEEDLARRDFTINAMAMDVTGKITDPFDGLQDIMNHTIRCVGNPNDRFNEDALRMLRAIRFESKLENFIIDENTRLAIKNNAEKIQNVSAERIREELTKILTSPYYKQAKQSFIDAYELGITKQILPEFDRMMECEQNHPYHYANVGIHSLDMLHYTMPDNTDSNLRWAVLLHDCGKPDTKVTNNGKDSFPDHNKKSRQIADNIMDRLKFSNKEKFEIGNLIENHDLILHKDSRIRLFSATYGKEFIEKLYKLAIADSIAHRQEYIQTLIDEKTPFFKKALDFIKDGTAIRLQDLKINGNDLKSVGLKGIEIGNYLKEAYTRCLGQPECNDYEKLLASAQKYKEKLDIIQKKKEKAEAFKPKNKEKDIDDYER